MGVQTHPGPSMIPANRLCGWPILHHDALAQAYDVMLSRSKDATTASKRYELCDYCDRARGLYVLVPPPNED